MSELSTNSFGSRFDASEIPETDLVARSQRRRSLSRAKRAMALYVLSDGSVDNFRAWFVLGPFHDDVAANQWHDRPAGDLPAFVDRPRRYRVEKLLGDFGAPFQIDDD